MANYWYKKILIEMNIDHEEVSKFAAKAHTWWDVNGELKTLHDVNPVRMKFIKSWSNHGLNGEKALDIGCGGGLLCETMRLEGADVTGIDVSEECISVADLHTFESNLSIEYQLTTIENFAMDNTDLFDVICCLEMIEHVPEPESIVQHALRLLKPNGKLFFSTLNRNLKTYLTAIVGAEYLLNLIPRGSHQYAKLIKPSELVNAIEKYGGRGLAIKGIKYNPLTRYAKLTNDPSVNYILCATK